MSTEATRDMDPAAPVDAAAVVREIAETVARRRAAGEYPAELLARLEEDFDVEGRLVPLEELAHIETVRPLGSARGRAAQAAVTAKRAVRRAVAFYVRPLAEDQTRFNFAAVRRIAELERRIAALEAERRGDAPPPPG